MSSFLLSPSNTLHRVGSWWGETYCGKEVYKDVWFLPNWGLKRQIKYCGMSDKDMFYWKASVLSSHICKKCDN